MAAFHTLGSFGDPEDGAQSSFIKAPEMTELPEIIEVADMDELFESMKDIVNSTIFGAFRSGVASFAQPSTGLADIMNAKQTLKATLKMNVKTAFHPGRVDTLKEPIKTLNAAKVLQALPDSALLSFGEDFSTFNQSFASFTRDLQIIEEKLEEGSALMNEIAQKSSAWEALRPKIKSSKQNKKQKKREEAAKEVQDLEGKLKMACERLQ